MNVHNVYAVVLNEKVTNLIVADNINVAQKCVRMIFNDANAIEANYYKVSIGDYYRNGKFYFKDGVTEIPRELTFEQKATQKIDSIDDVVTNQADILYEMSLMQLGMI